MSLRINTNIMAINTHRNMQMTDLALSKSLEKLSSGLRVNRAADDAAGLSISENLRSQVRGLAQAERNAQDGISLINVAEGALNEIHAILQRQRELLVQAANGALGLDERLSIQTEFRMLTYEIQNISQNTSFNGLRLLDGTLDPASPTFYQGAPLRFQVGANSGQTLDMAIRRIDASTLLIAVDNEPDGVLDNYADISSTPAAAAPWLPRLDYAIGLVSQVRSGLGALSNRLEHTINNIAVSRENMAAAESRIRDVDMAAEMTRLTRSQILMQSATAMLAQANAQPKSVLGLLS